MTLTTRICKTCGGEFTCDIDVYRRDFCSPACRYNYPPFVERRMEGVAKRAKIFRDSCKLPKPTEHARYIALNAKSYVTLSPVDYDWLSQYSWTYHQGYAINDRIGLMHRLIIERIIGVGLETSIDVDHEDLNGLNNLRTNLRLATRAQNQANTRSRKRKYALDFKGVYQAPGAHSYQANIGKDYRNYYLGSFKTPEEAAWMYDQWAIQLNDGYARTNFDYIEVPRQ